MASDESGGGRGEGRGPAEARPAEAGTGEGKGGPTDGNRLLKFLSFRDGHRWAVYGSPHGYVVKDAASGETLAFGLQTETEIAQAAAIWGHGGPALEEPPVSPVASVVLPP